MFRWFFNRKAEPAAPAPPAPVSAPAPAVAPSRPTPTFVDDARWTADIRSAAGDEVALLTLIQKAPSVTLKLAALAALNGEPALKRAVRELRDQDKRVYREAKRRFDALVAEREAREHAGSVLDDARALAAAPTIAANRVTALEKRWSAIDAALLDDATRGDWAALLDDLTRQMRERGERQQALERWLRDAAQALASVEASMRTAAAEALPGLTATLADVAGRAPDDPSTSAWRDRIAAAIAETEALQQRLAERAALPPEPVPEPVIAQSTPTTPPTPVVDAEQRQAQQARRREAHARLAEVLDQTEGALAEGRLADALRLLHGAPAPDDAPPALAQRLNAVQAEVARLQGWQHWGGGRVRDDLVVEAEALARQVMPVDGLAPVKLAIGPHAAAIDGLRRRWKDLDRLGAAGNQALWRRFDEALTAAHAPVAAQIAEQKATRQRNLDERLRLLDALDAVPLAPVEPALGGETPADDALAAVPASVEGDAVATPSTSAETTAGTPVMDSTDATSSPDFKTLLRVLDQFRADWRSLGPVEHTVPRAERDALAQRERDSVARLEAPLQAARRVAQAEREALIAQAEAIAAEAARTQARDTILRVRDLQAAWQQHAKGLPLARQVEGALWTRFKAATDAVFAQRDSALQARDAQFAAQAAEREALVVQLESLAPDASPDTMRRALDDADRRWRHLPPAPRQVAAGLDARFQTVFDATRARLAASLSEAWHRQCDALCARIALCDAFEDALPAGIADDAFDARWSEAAVPKAWDRPLTQRRDRLRQTRDHGGNWPPDGATPGAVDATLLQLETALDLASPAEWQAARRDLKLQAMKAALEGRMPVRSTPDAELLLAQALAHTPTNAAQRERLAAVVTGMRARVG